MPTPEQYETKQALDRLPEYQREILREDVEELIRIAYNAGWMESKRWPNRSQPPELEIDWTQPGGMRITEMFT